MLRSLLSLLLLANFSPALTFPVNTDFQNPELSVSTLVPIKSSQAIMPLVEAKAGLLMDMDSGLIPFEKNSGEALPMASLTKIMTAVLILESHDTEEVVTVSSNFEGLEGVRLWLKENERLKVGDLLKALLINSAGDAALALAEHHSGKVETFVEEMNERAHELELNRTHFANPIGLDDKNHYASALDLAHLTRYALRFSVFREIVQMPAANISSVDGKFEYDLENTNRLLNSYLDIRGVKTGTTDAAGEALINLARNPEGHEVISVLLGSSNRFQESKGMLDWAFRSYNW